LELLYSLHPFASAAAYWSTGVLNVTLDITIDTYFVFACNKIKSVLSIEHTYGITSHCKSTTHSDEQ